MVKIVIFGDLHLDNVTDGRRNKDGIPVRVIDTYNNLIMVKDFAIKNNVEYVLYSGDTYRTNKPAKHFQVMFHEIIMDMVEYGIKIIMIPGNHDMTKNETSKHVLSEFQSLRIPNVTVCDTAEILQFDEFQLVCLPWNYTNYIPDFQLEEGKTSICLGHCSTWSEDNPLWDRDESETYLGKDYFIPLDYFMQFDFTVLGHIHSPITFSEDPLICFPGAMERNTWGEKGQMSFVYIEGNNWNLIPYNLRAKYDLKNEIPDIIDPEGMYRLTTEDFDMSSADIHNAFSDAFSFKLKEIRKRTERQFRVVEEIAEMTPTQQLKVYFDEINEDFSEVEELWQTLYQ